MTPQEIERIERYQAIFAPHSYRLLKARTSEARFAHYTTAENAIKIIESRVIWMRSAWLMNDYMELDHGYQMMVKFLAEGTERRKRLRAILDDGRPGLSDQAFALFEDWWSDLRKNAFICSISEHDSSEDNHGRLSMWRAYGQSEARVALVLKMPTMFSAVGLRITLVPACYWVESQLAQELDVILDNIERERVFILESGETVAKTFLATSILTLVLSLKHVGFAEEKEWRLVYLPRIAPSALMRSSVENIKGIPQIVFKIPLHNNPEQNVAEVDINELLTRVIIGPSPYPATLVDSFVRVLTEAKLNNPMPLVVPSLIPLRT